jgi:hypothetical protein
MADCLSDPTGQFCLNCGWKKPERIKGWPRRNCGVQPDLAPAAARLGLTLADVGHYAQALARWTAAGFPVREQSEVERIEREICRPCEKYVNGSWMMGGRCVRCGCRVNTKMALVNKIAMATETCPLSKWPGDPTADKPSPATPAVIGG